MAIKVQFLPLSSHMEVEDVIYRPQLFYQIEQDIAFNLKQNLASHDEAIRVLWCFLIELFSKLGKVLVA